MLKQLIESLIIETLENNQDLNKEIDYIYKTLNSNFTTDLQKEIINTNTDIQNFKILTHSILNNEEFQTELKDMDLI